jgi:hypothetical protein
MVPTARSRCEVREQTDVYLRQSIYQWQESRGQKKYPRMKDERREDKGSLLTKKISLDGPLRRYQDTTMMIG